jgi:hypothetical protein
MTVMRHIDMMRCQSIFLLWLNIPGHQWRRKINREHHGGLLAYLGEARSGWRNWRVDTTLSDELLRTEFRYFRKALPFASTSLDAVKITDLETSEQR